MCIKELMRLIPWVLLGNQCSVTRVHQEKLGLLVRIVISKNSEYDLYDKTEY